MPSEDMRIEDTGPAPQSFDIERSAIENNDYRAVAWSGRHLQVTLMSGADLAQAARARKPGLPILIVSGYANPDGIAPDLSRLRKPFRSAELAQSIASLVRQDVGGGA